ncbi:baseplate J protein [Carnobacterium maltaromaticum]|uniref:baseplate J/gp47 family protein n=1 Tax=Carnobacterium maltaromaticum TaxID=2751 RepID=UPI000C78A5A5|nr:baseplate J/gp47 family protein [Carnobacterium maltaromaticum]PLS38270.1 baseplate J protein [Carnobacterium maltaromaticum]PLS38647.1 baseplate J protein [Carnobacterium maltaromaticum]PLS39024.1 baseplate J protein [Carnobacterium maltaromaticum]PLS45294.1 baseplate J protein [Carnobacterium maltaromaticum]PLS48149.1 baseplate J protein [Carnobacterium maltaromaticum]
MIIEELGTFLEKYTFETLIESALNQVPQDIDIREGSIIYDALAPACYQLADFYMQLKNVLLDTFPQTAIGNYLDLKVAEHGLIRSLATKAMKIAYFQNEDGQPMSLPIGFRLSSIETDAIIYRVKEATEDAGYYQVEAETSGTAGNKYLGSLLPIDTISKLAKASIVSLFVPARDTESDDELRQRFFSFINEKSFGGNFIEYILKTKSLDGVGSVQVYPIWNGGGTVKLALLDTEYNLVKPELLEKVQELIDPIEHTGNGKGFAPIGHKVTVVSPTKLSLNLAFKIDLMTGYTVEQLRPFILQALEKYFLSIRKQWDQPDESNFYYLTIYRSQLISAILGIVGIANISEMKLNGKESDLELTMNATKQEIPFLNKVEIS